MKGGMLRGRAGHWTLDFLIEKLKCQVKELVIVVLAKGIIS